MSWNGITMPKSKLLFQIKGTNASARAVEKAKTYDDFDWEKLIRTKMNWKTCISPSLISI